MKKLLCILLVFGLVVISFSYKGISGDAKRIDYLKQQLLEQEIYNLEPTPSETGLVKLADNEFGFKHCMSCLAGVYLTDEKGKVHCTYCGKSDSDTTK